MPSDAMKQLAQVYRHITGAEEGANQIRYEDLPRPQQNLLVRLFGGGTLRNADETALRALSNCGLIRGEKLTALGEEVCREALPIVRGRLGAFALSVRPESDEDDDLQDQDASPYSRKTS